MKGVVYTAAIQSDGKVLISSDFSTVGDTSRSSFSFLRNGALSLNSIKNGAIPPNSPQASIFTLAGLNLLTAQEIVISETGSLNGSTASNEN